VTVTTIAAVSLQQHYDLEEQRHLLVQNYCGER